jgi:hypothetical protein
MAEIREATVTRTIQVKVPVLEFDPADIELLRACLNTHKEHLNEHVNSREIAKRISKMDDKLTDLLAKLR